MVRNGDTRTTFLKRFCNNFRSPKIVYSTGNIMFLELRTSDALKNGGFKAEWDSKPIPKKGTLLPDIDTIYTHSYIWTYNHTVHQHTTHEHTHTPHIYISHILTPNIYTAHIYAPIITNPHARLHSHTTNPHTHHHPSTHHIYSYTTQTHLHSTHPSPHHTFTHRTYTHLHTTHLHNR